MLIIWKAVLSKFLERDVLIDKEDVSDLDTSSLRAGSCDAVRQLLKLRGGLVSLFLPYILLVGIKT